MATVDKRLADILIANNGYYEDDPRIVRIIEYDNAFGGVSYGLEHVHEVGKYAESEFVRNPRVYWQVQRNEPLDWRKVCLALLVHFDAMEGTTYLYSREDRKSFAKQFDHSAEVLEMLNDYHERKR